MNLREKLERVPPRPQPWQPWEATRVINKVARDLDLDLIPTRHALDRMDERDLFSPDILHVLRNGNVYGEAERAKRPHRGYNYLIDFTTPNTGPRKVRCVVAVKPERQLLILVTVMWVDEARTKR